VSEKSLGVDRNSVITMKGMEDFKMIALIALSSWIEDPDLFDDDSDLIFCLSAFEIKLIG
jgi:hypothetical protein